MTIWPSTPTHGAEARPLAATVAAMNENEVGGARVREESPSPCHKPCGPAHEAGAPPERVPGGSSSARMPKMAGWR